MRKIILGDAVSPISGEWGNGDGGVNVLRSTNFTNDGHLDYSDIAHREIGHTKIDAKRLLVGDVLIEKSGGSPTQPVGRVVYFESDGEFLTSNFLSALRVHDASIYPKYLFYWLFAGYRLGFTKPFQNKTTGIINLQLKRFLQEVEVPVPPLEEQRRIAGILDEADLVRKKTQALIDKYDELAQSLFLDMFGDPVTNPKGWSVVGLSEICEYFIGLTYKPTDIGEFGIPVLRSGNVQNGQLDFSDLVRVTCPVKEKIELRKGDILMCSRNGSARLVGKCAVVNDLDKKMTFGAFMTVLRTEHTRFIEHFLRLPAFRRQIATGATTTVNQITKNMLDQIALPLPPRALELRFSLMIEELEKQREASLKELNQQQNLFNALLQKAFKGELT